MTATATAELIPANAQNSRPCSRRARLSESSSWPKDSPAKRCARSNPAKRTLTTDGRDTTVISLA
jgi:hypothetical protein